LKLPLSYVLYRLRQRVNFLIERSSKTSPEDWRRLQQERDGLSRQLSGEKEAHQKTQEENRGLRQEKSRLEEQVRNYFVLLH
jgi:nucleoprotein TPR